MILNRALYSSKSSSRTGSGASASASVPASAAIPELFGRELIHMRNGEVVGVVGAAALARIKQRSTHETSLSSNVADRTHLTARFVPFAASCFLARAAAGTASFRDSSGLTTTVSDGR